MIAPVRTLRKKDMEWLGTHNCKHGHTYLVHYDCFLKEAPDDSPFKERIGYFDIEASNLNANFGYVFSYAIATDGKKVLGRVLRPKEIRTGAFDSALMAELCNDLRKFNRIVVHYGGDGRFDCPFVRSRALKAHADFPLYKEIYVSDTWRIARNKLKLSSNRLDTICKFFGIEAKTHPMDFDRWCLAMTGDTESLDYIWAHNVEDAISLREVYHILNPYARVGKESL